MSRAAMAILEDVYDCGCRMAIMDDKVKHKGKMPDSLRAELRERRDEIRPLLVWDKDVAAELAKEAQRYLFEEKRIQDRSPIVDDLELDLLSTVSPWEAYDADSDFTARTTAATEAQDMGAYRVAVRKWVRAGLKGFVKEMA